MKYREIAVIVFLFMCTLPQCTKKRNPTAEGIPAHTADFLEYKKAVELATNSAYFQAEIFRMHLPKNIPTKQTKTTIVHPFDGHEYSQ